MFASKERQLDIVETLFKHDSRKTRDEYIRAGYPEDMVDSAMNLKELHSIGVEKKSSY